LIYFLLNQGDGGISIIFSLRTNAKQPGEYDAYFHMHNFHSSSSTSREERAKRDHAWKHLYLIPLFEFHDSRHFMEFVLNFKVPYSKGISKWVSRLPCISKGSSKEVKEAPQSSKKSRSSLFCARKS